MSTFFMVFININMTEMNSKENIFDILKYNDPRPNVVRHWIDSCLDKPEIVNGPHISDWVAIQTDGSLGSIYVKNTFFFEIFVYYSKSDDCTLLCIKLKDPSYSHRIMQDYILQGLDTYVIYCDGMEMDEFCLEFDHVFNEFNKYCRRTEYMGE